MERKKLIELRGERSQVVIANELGISQQFLSYIERGERTPNIKLMKEFERYYETPMEELFPDIFLSTNTTICGYKDSNN
ncbi:helix-turn-helix transcriptional regulator [Tepidanaerobacter syntrophicus]|uniref:helix-turn-helix transcriptional regulator n=1 Tax=Tepidanaerobacter syntrophicus TaxID=224999 RepID=UPI001BD35F80|nr:helix-turn-helix transcriptional regulator [Tepidanaerobacter syntrophicus]